jgi:23S rRNA (cytosine1962-C5)-methyltransferase
MAQKRLILARKKEHSLQRKHPWVFSGAVARMEGEPQPGDTVDVLAADGQWLARAAMCGGPQIRARAWSFDDTVEIGPDFFRQRVAQALALRQRQYDGALPSACRLVFGESDGLPGLTVDKYGQFLACQFHAAGVESHREAIVKALGEAAAPAGLWDRSDSGVREREGLGPSQGLLAGQEPPPLLEIEEQGCRFLVDIRGGQKTGFYLDQRINRQLAEGYSRGAEVLNAFSYTGGFAVRALKGGATRVTNIDTSAASLDLARRNVELNGLSVERMENVEGDVFKVLREYRDRARQFDLIVLDPPKFAETRGHLEKACRGYKDVNLLAIKLLRPGGALFTFSCSGAITEELFQKVVAGAALDSGRDVRVERRLSQAPDHPVLLSFPESAYLKGLVCRV